MADCLPSDPQHLQAAALTPWGDLLLVDIGMSEILEECWRLGLDTEYSCQESHADGKAYILFSSGEHADSFLSYARGVRGTETDDWDSLYRRVGRAAHWQEGMHPMAWEIWTTYTSSHNPEWDAGLSQGIHRLKVAVRFPAQDRLAVLSNLRLLRA